jgi:protein-L-isoaspartate O-methyltransferase
MMIEQLRPPVGGCVLEIGAGTGYNAALLSVLVGSSGRVVTVDIDAEVAGEARGHLAEAGVGNVEVICGDGAAGWAGGAPYDGIIVTAGVSDLAPAWIGQLAAGGRLVVPLSIRGVQHCVGFTWADGSRVGVRLRSVSVREGGFMPLAGAMANSDMRLPVPGRAGVYVLAAQGMEVDTALIADALDGSAPRSGLGVTASVREVAGSLRRWLAFHDRSVVSLAYLGPPEAADASGVPPVLSGMLHGIARRSSWSPAGMPLTAQDPTVFALTPTRAAPHRQAPKGWRIPRGTRPSLSRRRSQIQLNSATRCAVSVRRRARQRSSLRSVRRSSRG